LKTNAAVWSFYGPQLYTTIVTYQITCRSIISIQLLMGYLLRCQSQWPPRHHRHRVGAE